MSESQDQPTRVLDYRNPATGRRQNGRYGASYWPGWTAAGLLVVVAAGVFYVDSSYEVYLLASIPFACLQVVLGVSRLRELDREQPWRVRAGPLLLGLLMVILTVGPCVLQWLEAHFSRGDPGRVKCASNLRQIGQVIALYAQDNSGAYPPSLIPLSAELNPEVFVCPSSDDTAAAAADAGLMPHVVAAILAQPGHISYVYVGAGMDRKTVVPEMVIAHDRLENHDGTGMHVLYGDGHVDWQHQAEAQYILDELKAGHNPARERPYPPSGKAP